METTIRLYRLKYPDATNRVFVTDAENNVLYPSYEGQHVLAVYGGGHILDFKFDASIIAAGSKVVSLRLSHLNSCQLIRPDSGHVATVCSVSSISRDEYDIMINIHRNQADRRAEAEARIKDRIAKKLASAQRKLAAEEIRAIEKLGKSPSLEEMLSNCVAK